MKEPANNSLITEVTCQLLPTDTVWVDTVDQTKTSYINSYILYSYKYIEDLQIWEFVYISCSSENVGAYNMQQTLSSTRRCSGP